MPEKVAEALAPYNNKSKFIAEALMEKIERDTKKRLDSLLVEGYKSQHESDDQLNNEWEGITLESWSD